MTDRINHNVHNFSNSKNQEEMGLFSKKTKCSKFFTYKANTFEITGVSVGMKEQFNFDIGRFKLLPEYVKVSEKLMQMDFQQYSLCESISNISDKKVRDEMLKNVVKIQMEIMANLEQYENKKKTNEENGDNTTQVDGNNNADSEKISIPKILERFKTKSSVLRNEKSVLGGDYSIKRRVVKDIVDWVQKPQVENPICIVKGNAGIGKTVVLKNVLLLLEEYEIPVLAIKTDRLGVKSLDDLNKALELKSIFDTFSELSDFSYVVLLLDQLDTLSLSSSNKRGELGVYYNLIAELKAIKNIRIVFSARTFDLSNDPILMGCIRLANNSKKKAEQVEVKLLEEGELQKVLSAFSIDHNLLQKTQVELLKTPLHLDIFLEIYEETAALEELNSLEKLYNGLWEKKVGASDEILYQVVENMSSTQLFTFDTKKLLNEKKELLKKPISEGILILDSNSGKVAFFHQTFFDYAAARWFYYSGKSLSEYIQKAHQGLELRPTVKVTLEYLRGVDSVEYVSELNKILGNDATRFHIRKLISDIIGFQKKPISGEKKVVKKYLLEKSSLRYGFTERANSEGWWNFFEEHDILEAILEAPNVAWSLFKNAAVNNPIPAIDYLLNNTLDTKKYAGLARCILWNVETWTKDVEKLYEKYESTIDKRVQEGLLQKAMVYDSAWVWQKITNYLKILESPPDSDFDVRELIQELFKLNPTQSLDFAIELLLQEIDKKNYNRNGLKHDVFLYGYCFIEERGNEYSFRKDWQRVAIEYVYETLIKLSKNDTVSFKRYLHNLMSSDYYTFLKMGLSILIKSEENYTSDVFSLFEHFQRMDKSVRHDLGYYWQKVLNRYILKFDEQQQEVVKSFILNFKDSFLRLSQRDEFKDSFFKLSQRDEFKSSEVEQLAYLSSLPKDFMLFDKGLKRRYQELELKYPQPYSSPEGGITTSWIETKSEFEENKLSSLPKEKASEILENRNVKQEFGKPHFYSNEKEFARLLLSKPEDWISKLEEYISEPDKAEFYIQGIGSLVAINHDANEIRRLFKLIANKVGNCSKYTYSLLSVVEHLREQLVVDLDILSFLEECIRCTDLKKRISNLQINAPTSIKSEAKDVLFESVNNVVGHAVFILVKLNQQPELKEKIFELLEKALDIDDKQSQIRPVIVSCIWNLWFLDKERALNIFIKAVQTEDSKVLYLSYKSSVHFIRFDFERLHTYIRTMMDTKETHEQVGKLLLIAALHDYPKAKEWLEEGLSNSEEIKCSVVHCAFNSEEKNRPLLLDILNRYALDASEKVSRVYQSAFIRLARSFDGVQFKKRFLPMLKKFVQIPRTDISPFYEYLLKATKDYPEECLDLMKTFDKHTELYNKYAIKVLIESYRGLEDEDIKKQAMDIFDRMLEHPTYTTETEGIMKEMDVR